MPVSILTGSEEPVQRYEVNTWTNPNAVSILTGSEEPVQLADKGFLRERTVVSILTGSEEPVQQYWRAHRALACQFQSSPAPKSRCNATK